MAIIPCKYSLQTVEAVRQLTATHLPSSVLHRTERFLVLAFLLWCKEKPSEAFVELHIHQIGIMLVALGPPFPGFDRSQGSFAYSVARFCSTHFPFQLETFSAFLSISSVLGGLLSSERDHSGGLVFLSACPLKLAKA